MLSSVDSLISDNSPPNASANAHSLSVNANFDVYPNIAEPTEWWRLGNLKTDGVDKIINAYRDETTPGMKMNRETPISELALKYGDRSSSRLYHKDDLVCRWLHQWGVDYMEGRK